MLTCVFLWALIPVVSKIGQTDLDNHQFLFWSSFVSVLGFAVVICIKKKATVLLKYNIKEWVHILFLGLLGTYLYYILLYFGYAQAQGLEVLVLQYSWPVFIVVLSLFFLKEKLRLFSVLAIILGFAGVVIVLTKGDFANLHFNNIGVDAIVLIAALTFALFSVLSKKAKYENYTMIFIYFVSALIASFFSMLFLSEFRLPSFNSLIPILVNGLLVNGFSYIYWIKALKEADASFVAPFVFLTPVLSAVYLLVFFNEPYHFAYGIGLAAVVAGGLLNSFSGKRA